MRILGPKRNLDHNLSSALISMLMSSSKLFLFSKDVHLNSGVRRLLELYCDLLCCCHQACCLLYYLGEINMWHSHVPVYLWILTLLFSDVVVVSDWNKYFGGSTDLAKKRQGSADLHTPIRPSPKWRQSFFTSVRKALALLILRSTQRLKIWLKYYKGTSSILECWK